MSRFISLSSTNSMCAMFVFLPGSWFGSSQDGAHLGQHLCRGRRAFLNDAFDPTVQAAPIVLGEIFRRDYNYRNPWGCLALAERVHELKSVHLRHHQVQKD